MCDQAKDTHLKASDPATWDTVYHGTYKHGMVLFVWQGCHRAGHIDTLKKTRALLLMDTGEMQFLTRGSCFVWSDLCKRAVLQQEGTESLAW